MTSGVYAIINPTTGRAYIGSSIDIEARWIVHRTNLRLGHTLAREMIDVWQALGVDGFEWLILESVEQDDDALEAAERRWIKHYEGRLYNTRKRARRARASLQTLTAKAKWAGPRTSAYTLRRLERRQWPAGGREDGQDE